MASRCTFDGSALRPAAGFVVAGAALLVPIQAIDALGNARTTTSTWEGGWLHEEVCAIGVLMSDYFCCV